MIFSISPLAGLGNRMLEYMAVSAIGNLVGGEIKYNVDLPHWGFIFNADLHEQLLSDEISTLVIYDKDALALSDVANIILNSKKKAVVFFGYFQRFNLLLEPSFYQSTFGAKECDQIFHDDELVIHIRSGDILKGVQWYPLVPVNFFKSLIAKTGLRPVFLGQIDDCKYVDEIRASFPEARIIPQADAMVDFNRLRHAKNICIAVSTFSWLAAWLSDSAKVIYYPVLGFLHPASFRFGTHGLGGINMVPHGDSRFRFELFPLINGEPESSYLEFVRNINPISKEIPSEQLILLGHENSILPRISYNDEVDSAWYLKKYIEAAWEISEGWYYNAAHHYGMIGKLRGYHPHPNQ